MTRHCALLSVAAASRLGRQLEEVIASLSKVKARFALIGGLALASHKVIRATRDIDLLTDSKKAEDIDRELVAIGYQCLHRGPGAGNYLRGDKTQIWCLCHPWRAFPPACSL
jgi:hypothetical protein